MNESSEVAGENEQLSVEQITAEIMRRLGEVAEVFEGAFSMPRRFVPVRITVPVEWPRQLLN
jgi:hypothetical protein